MVAERKMQKIICEETNDKVEGWCLGSAGLESNCEGVDAEL